MVDPHRITALELDQAMREMEQKLEELRETGQKQFADDKAEASRAVAALEERLKRTSEKKASEEKMAKRRELRLGLAALLISLFLGWQSVVDFWESFEFVAVFRILHHKVEALEPEMYVSRPQEEARMAPLIGVPSLEYDVLVGPRGCGKSSVALHVASGHQGVATFSVASETDNAYIRIVKAFGISPKHYDLDDHRQLVHLLQKASKWHGHLRSWGFFSASSSSSSTNKWVPTIIVEIDHRAGQDTIAAIAKQLKIVASDTKAARVILVLSDANAQFALPGDGARQKVIWVNDLTEAEAREVMDKHNFLATEEEKQMLFRRMGTRVADLVRLIGDVQRREVPSIEAAVNARIVDAKKTIRRLLEVKFRPDDPNKIEFKKIFDALLKSPTGVPVALFSGATGIPRLCGPHFKEEHAFSYYNPDDQYVFYSRAHLEAAKELRFEKKY